MPASPVSGPGDTEDMRTGTALLLLAPLVAVMIASGAGGVLDRQALGAEIAGAGTVMATPGRRAGFETLLATMLFVTAATAAATAGAMILAGARGRGGLAVALPGAGRGMGASAPAAREAAAMPCVAQAWVLRTMAADDPAEADRRAHARIPLRQAVRLELAGRPAVAANLLDLSEGGAGVAAPAEGAPLGTTGLLVLDTAVLEVRVASVAEGRLGLALLAPSSQALATIRRVMAESGRTFAA